MLDSPKRRIRKNVWDNWYGYEGTKRTQAFAESVEFSAEQDANHWLETGERLTVCRSPYVKREAK